MTHPTKTSRRFTAQQKAEAVELCLQEGLSCNAVAQRLGLPSSSLARWVRQVRIDRGQPGPRDQGLLTSEDPPGSTRNWRLPASGSVVTALPGCCRCGSSGASGVAENLLQQDFQPPAPNRCWTGDITYIRTTAGWRYLAVWIDLYSRRVVGWKLDQRMDAALVIEALNRALGQRKVEPETLLIYTGQGSQYRASDYRDLLSRHEISCSMSAKGCCWDNAVMESFFSTLA